MDTYTPYISRVLRLRYHKQKLPGCIQHGTVWIMNLGTSWIIMQYHGSFMTPHGCGIYSVDFCDSNPCLAPQRRALPWVQSLAFCRSSTSMAISTAGNQGRTLSGIHGVFEAAGTWGWGAPSFVQFLRFVTD